MVVNVLQVIPKRRRRTLSRILSKKRPRLGKERASERANVSFVVRRTIGRRNVLSS